MERDEFAEILMSKERRKWQNPEAIIKRIGIREGMVVADLACGPGFFTVPIAERVGAKGKVYAVDSDARMIHHLRANLRKSKLTGQVVKTITADVSDTGIPSASTDVSLFANIMHDLDDKASFLQEVKRVSKADALIVDIDWRKGHTEFGPPFEIRLSQGESKRILSRAGLRLMRAFEAGPYHYGLVYQRPSRTR